MCGQPVSIKGVGQRPGPDPCVLIEDPLSDQKSQGMVTAQLGESENLSNGRLTLEPQFPVCKLGLFRASQVKIEAYHEAPR